VLAMLEFNEFLSPSPHFFFFSFRRGQHEMIFPIINRKSKEFKLKKKKKKKTRRRVLIFNILKRTIKLTVEC
jgi:hypothetical protein